MTNGTELAVAKTETAMAPTSGSPATASKRSAGKFFSNRYAVITVLSPCLIILVWDLVTRFGLVPPILLPSPGTIVLAFVDVLQNGYSGIAIWTHILASVGRILI